MKRNVTLLSFIAVLALLLVSATGSIITLAVGNAGNLSNMVQVGCNLLATLAVLWLFLHWRRVSSHGDGLVESVLTTTEASLFLLDGTGRFIGNARGPCHPLPFPKPTQSGKTMTELFDRDFAVGFEMVFAQTAQDGKRRTFRYTREEAGRQYFFEARIGRSQGTGPSGYQLTMVINNISNHIRFERMQAHNIRWFRTMFNKLSEAVVLSDAGGIIRGLNQRTMELYGFQKQELLDQPLAKLFAEGRVEKGIDELPDAENPVRVAEYRHLHRDGSPFPVEVRSSPIRIENQDFTLSLIRDVTFQKELEDQQRHYERSLLDQNAMRDKLFSILAHDLRGPIGNLQSFLSAYHLDRSLFSPTDFEEFLEDLRISTNATWGLLENLLSWVRNQFSDLSINQMPVGLLATCHTVVAWLMPQAQAKHQEIRVGTIVDHMLMTDANMLQTVIRNLLGNAIKFTPEGGGIGLRVVSGDAEIGIVVEDSGPGIPAHRLPDLFALRGGSSTLGTAGEKGSGLGLVLCREITERLGGRIQVESSNKGTVFTVWLPADVEGELDIVE